MKSKSSAEKTIGVNRGLAWLFTVTVTALTCWTSTTSLAQSCAPTPSGLVSWWRGENNALDQNLSNNGTLIGNTSYGSGKVGNAFVFDGDHNAVSVGNPANLQLQNFTIEAWVKRNSSTVATLAPEAAPGTGAVFCYAWGGYGLYLYDDGRIGMGKLGDSGVISTVSTTDTNSFHHIAVSKSGGTVVFYLDGVSDPVAGSYNPSFSFGGPAAIGARGGDWVGTLFGAVDEVSIYNRALSTNEIQAIYTAGIAGKCVPAPPPACTTTPSGLAGWWRGENNANDTSHTNHGTLQNGATFAAGRVGQAFSLDGVDDYVQVGNRPELVMSNALSIEAWIYPTGARSGSGGEGAIVNKEGEYEIGLISDGTVRWSIKDPSSPMTWTVTPLVAPLNTWTHVALVYGSGSVKIYGNGSLLQSYAGPSTIGDELPGLDDFRIGGRQAISENFKGLLDEVSVYRSALTAGDIAAIYAAGSGGKCGLSIPPFVSVQPTGQTVVEGSAVSLSVTAGGTAPFSYQWRKASSPMAGATNAILPFSNVTTNDTGGYDVVITNIAGSTASGVAMLTVNPAVCVNPPSGLVGWWRGENNADDPNSGLNGTLQSGATFATGKVGQAFSFDGVNDYVQVGDRPELVMSNAMTIEAWIYPTGSGGAPDGSGIIVNREGEYEIGRTAAGTIRFAIAVPNSPWVWTDTALVAPLNTWTHFALVYGSSSVKIYGNGTLLQAYGGPAVISDVLGAQNDFRIGGRQAGSEPFKGLIDELSVYRTALTAGDIAAIYGASSFGKCVIPISPFITQQPANQTVIAGGNVTFAVGAGGSAPLSYQWLYNSNVVNNATNSSLTLSNVQVSQAGAYSVVVTNSLGLASSSNAMLTVNFPTAMVRLVGTNVASDATFSVPVQLVANGNENALGFTLNFSTSRVSYAEVTLGSGAAGGALIVNSSQANLGRVGVAVALPADATFAAGTQELVRVSFVAAIVTSATLTTLSFGDTPIMRQLSDAPGNDLPVSFASGNVVIAAAEYEGDVSPRPNGSKTVTITDWVLVGRYAALLEAPTNSSEFQRADCAPRHKLGNGAITVSDWVQAGRYAAALDPLTVAGGPTAGSGLLVAAPTRSNPKGSGPSGLTGRQVVASSTSLLQGDTTTVRVNLVSEGDENALSFSLAFDPAALSFTGATPGSGTSGATLNVNTNQIGLGRLGLVLALPTGAHFLAGTQETVKVNFQSGASAAGTFSVSLMDQPLVREVANPEAIVLEASYVNGTVVLNPPPSLRIARAGQNLNLAWPLWATGFGLQVADSTASVNWTNLVVTPAVLNNENVVVQPLGSETKFYRLSRP